jgi:hypothetical protein
MLSAKFLNLPSPHVDLEQITTLVVLCSKVGYVVFSQFDSAKLPVTSDQRWEKCHKYNCNITLFASAFICIQI